jgi:hypothetical protein
MIDETYAVWLANSISYLGAGFLRAIELADIEARLAELERQNRR